MVPVCLAGFSSFGSSVFKREKTKTTICCYSCIIESRIWAMKRQLSEEMDVFRDSQQEKSKNWWQSFTVKSFPLRSAAWFRIFVSRNNNKQFVPQIELTQFGVQNLSSHPHRKFHVDKCPKIQSQKVGCRSTKTYLHDPFFDWMSGLLLEGWSPKIEDKQVPGIYIYINDIYNLYI